MNMLTQDNLTWLSICAEDEIARDIETFQCFLSQDIKTIAIVNENHIPQESTEKTDYLRCISKTDLFYLVFFGQEENSIVSKEILVEKYFDSQESKKLEILSLLVDQQNGD